jgi:viologen exporter family transport system permease protein
VRRYLRLFGQYFLQYCKVRLEYRGDLIVSVAATVVATALGLALVFILFNRTQAVAGWSFEEILFLYGFGLVPLALFNTISVNLYYFGQVYIIEGKFDRVLLRPVHSLFQVMSEQFRLEALSDALVGVVLILYAGLHLDLSFSPLAVAAGVAAAVCGFVIYVAVFLLLTCVSFWVEDRVGIIPPIYNLLTFGRYPLDIYHPLIKVLLSWVVPFAFAAFYPSAKFLGHDEYARYFLAMPLVAGAFLAAAVILWNRGVKNYASTGS